MATRLAVKAGTCLLCGGAAPSRGRSTFTVSGRSVGAPFYYCRRCDLFWRRIPLDAQIERFEHAGYTAPDNRTKLLVRRQAFFEYVLSLIGRYDGSPPGTLLDVGASYGHLLGIAKRRGIGAAGVEIVPRLRDRIAEDLEIPCWSSLGQAQGSFDAVTFIDSFYYFDDPLHALDLTHGLLQPGGIAIFRVSNRNLMIRALGAVRIRRRFELLGDHFMGWSLRAMSRALDASGFDVIATRVHERGWRRPLRQWVSYVPSVAISGITKYWGLAVSPGIIVVARKR